VSSKLFWVTAHLGGKPWPKPHTACGSWYFEKISAAHQFGIHCLNQITIACYLTHSKKFFNPRTLNFLIFFNLIHLLSVYVFRILICFNFRTEIKRAEISSISNSQQSMFGRPFFFVVYCHLLVFLFWKCFGLL